VVAAVRAVDGQRVAVKYLSSWLLGDSQFVAAFRAEAALLRSLDVPHVVRLLEYVEAPGQGAAIVMELVEGVSLHEMIARQGPGSAESALVVLKGSLLGLAAAHALGIVHRDYKPENVLVDGSGQSKLADFGVAIRMGQGAPVGGTPLYMAPEQWNGEPATPATDIYAATAVFFECLTGTTPFSGPLGQLALQHTAAAVPVGHVDQPLRELITRGMAKSPEARPGNASQFLAELEATAAAAYGADWESRGRSQLAERAAALLLLLPPDGGAGAGAGTGTATASTRLRPARSAAHAGHAGMHAWLYTGIAAAVITVAAGSLAAVAVSRHHGGAPRIAASGSRPAVSSGTAVTSALLPVMACPSTYGAGGVPPAAYPSAERMALPAGLAGKVALYSDQGRSARPALGPAGWGCSVQVAADGSLVVSVFPPGESATGPMLVEAYRVPACVGCMYDAVCPLIPYAGKIFGSGLGSCPAGRVPGEVVTWLAGPKAYATRGFDVVGFTDPPGVHGYGAASGGAYPAHGVLLFTWAGAGSYAVSEMSCTVAPKYEATCKEILTLFQQQRQAD
jgi:serine/threonine-protein kinase